jgi:hypothetical protein
LIIETKFGFFILSNFIVRHSQRRPIISRLSQTLQNPNFPHLNSRNNLEKRKEMLRLTTMINNGENNATTSKQHTIRSAIVEEQRLR